MPGAAPIRKTSPSWRSDYPPLKVVKLEQNYRCSRPHPALRQHADREKPARAPQDSCGASTATASASASGTASDNEHEAEKRRRRDPLPASRPRKSPWSEFCHPVPRQPPVAAAGKGAAAAAHSLPPDRRHRVPGSRRGQGRAGLAAACSPIPTTTRPSCARSQSPKREVGAHHAGQAGRMAQQARLLAVARGRGNRPAQAAARRARRPALRRVHPHHPSPARSVASALTPAELARQLAEQSGLLAAHPRAVQGRGQLPQAPRKPRRTRRLVRRRQGRRRRRTGRATGAADPRRPRRSRQRGAADEPARRQGPGVPRGVHRRLRGRQPAARGTASTKAAWTRSAGCSTSASPAPRNGCTSRTAPKRSAGAKRSTCCPAASSTNCRPATCSATARIPNWNRRRKKNAAAPTSATSPPSSTLEFEQASAAFIFSRRPIPAW